MRGMTQIQGDYMKTNKIKLTPTTPPHRLKTVLPVLIKLQGIENHTPSEIMEILSHITSPEAFRILNDIEMKQLENYLDKYGYSKLWLKEVKDEE